MLVTLTLVTELEAYRDRLSAERDRIQREYEKLPTIETHLTAVEQILRDRRAQAVPEEEAPADVASAEAALSPTQDITEPILEPITEEPAVPSRLLKNWVFEGQRASKWVQGS